MTPFQEQQAKKILSLYSNFSEIIKSEENDIEKARKAAPDGTLSKDGKWVKYQGKWIPKKKWDSMSKDNQVSKETNTTEVTETQPTKSSSKKYKREKYKNKQLEVGDIIYRPDAKPGYYNYLKVASIDGDKVKTWIVDQKYGGKWEVVGDGGIWSKKVLEPHHNKKLEEKHNKQEDHKELVHNISTSIGLNKIKGGNLGDKKNVSELKSALEKLSKLVSNVDDSSVLSYYGGTKLSSTVSGQALSIVTNGVHRGDYYSGSTPFLIQIKVGGGLDFKTRSVLLDVSKKLLEKFNYESNLGKSRISDTSGTNWSSVMLTAPSDGSKYSILPSLDDLKNIKSK